MPRSFIYIPAPTASYANAKSISFGSSNSNKGINLGNTDFRYAYNNAFSFSCWIKVLGTGAYQRIICNLNSSNVKGLAFFLDPSQKLFFQFLGTTGGMSVITSSATISTNTWTQIGFTYSGTPDADAVRMYKNGASQTLTYNTYDLGTKDTVTSDNMYLGQDTTNAYYLSAKLDEVAFFNSKLADADMSTIYNSGVPADLSAMSSLTNYYRMGDGADDVTTSGGILDRKGTAHGTGVNLVSGDVTTDVP